MLRVFGPQCTAVPVDAGKLDALPEGAIWIDLFEPTREEEALAEKLVGSNIPTRAELSEIEPSSRLYQKRGVTHLTMSVLYGIVDGHPVLCRQGPVTVAAFHPELSGDLRLHDRFLKEI